ncbi:MAG: glycosyltransferase [Xanthomonadaceae bacterium]|nr:glycosyltransferase [Rhodospirillaceae bacterium]NIA17724.1 glycosyltransferase [Xanthomonadaceae bacterium]
MLKDKLKILFVAAEVAPIAKVGGLADVIGSLPKALEKNNCEVRIMLPFYGFIDKKKFNAKKIFSKIAVRAGGNKEKIDLWEIFLPQTKIPVYLIKHKFFDSKNIYNSGRIYYKNKYSRGLSDVKKFSFFAKAVLNSIKYLNFKPDIIHCHDWHASFIPVYLKMEDYKTSFYKNIKTVYTIHNLANQGIADLSILKFSQFNKEFASLKRDSENKDINFMGEGILNADFITTVSPSYAKEILKREFGAGLEKIVKKRKKDLSGIINGIDTDFFNPEKDKNIKQKYSFKNLNKKTENKLFLQKRLGLPVNKNIALAVLISRLVWQKGLELITKDFANLNCQFVFLGTGEKKYENYLKILQKKYPDKISANIMFDIKLANQIYAASDIFLMPSRFEPCGLGQLIAMRYGSVPVARATGGLKDTIKNFDFKATTAEHRKATGFLFNKFSSIIFYKKLNNALNLYYNNKKAWHRIQKNGMKKDFSWDNSAKKYLDLYKKLIK